MIRAMLVLAGLLSAAAPVHAQTVDAARMARIAGIGQVWSTVRFFHPWVAYRHDLDIDSAAIAGVAAVLRTTSTEEYRRAIGDMLAELEDPATRVLPDTPPDADRWRTSRGVPANAYTPDSTLIVALHHYEDVPNPDEWFEPSARIEDLRTHLRAARSVVLDMRTDFAGRRSIDDEFALRRFVERVLGMLAGQSVVPPAQRSLIRVGFNEDYSYWQDVFLATNQVGFMDPEREAHPKRVVLLVNENSLVPAYAAGLAAAGDVVIVSEGSLGDAPFVGHRDVDAGESVRVRVRTSELIDLTGVGAPRGSMAVQRVAERDAAMQAALRVLREPPRAVPAGSPLPAALVHRRPFVPRDSVPSPEARVFGLLKVWQVVATFTSMSDSARVRWDSVLHEFIPRMLDAATVTEYHLALAHLTNRLADSHSNLMTPPLVRWRGEAALPVRLALVEGELIVTAVAHDSLLGGAAIHRGDIIRTIDAEPALMQARRIAATFSPSSPGRADHDAAVSAGRGPLGTVATVVVTGADGASRTVRLPRHPLPAIRAHLAALSQGVRRVAPYIGYVDTGRVPFDSIDAVFAALSDTRAVVLDFRNAANAYAFTSRLMGPDSVVSPKNLTLLGDPPVSTRRGWGTLAMTTTCYCRDPDTHYTGLAVLLIGPRQQSNQEVNVHFLRLGSGTPLIGEPTSGTVGGVASIHVPGGIVVRYTPGSVADRAPIQPDVPVRPTIAGIRAGRDEVLEAAVSYLQARLRR